MSGHPVGTVLLAPEPIEDAPGRPQEFGDPDATRIVRIASPHPDDWPWRQHTDLHGWRVQPLWQVAATLGHPS